MTRARIDSDQASAPLLHLARDEHRLDMARVHQIDHRAERVVDRPEVETVGLQHDDVGILARRQRADLRVEIGAARALGRVANSSTSRQVSSGGMFCSFRIRRCRTFRRWNENAGA